MKTSSLTHTPDHTTAGLLLSLSSSLPASTPLARRARTVAHRLTHGACDRALQHRAADLLADLLDVADAAELADYDNGDYDLLTSDWDN